MPAAYAMFSCLLRHMLADADYFFFTLDYRYAITPLLPFRCHTISALLFSAFIFSRHLCFITMRVMRRRGADATQDIFHAR